MEFVGRGEELQKLQQMLQQNQQVAIAAIAGMGGVGKTELALQYAIEYRDNYQGGICWLLPKSGDIGVQIVQFARTLLDLHPPTDVDLPAQVQFCWRHWCEGEVLLVLDDVADYQEVKPYFVSLSSRFKILITTRQHWGRIAELPLNVLQPEAALELLKSIIGVERFERENQRNPQVALQLCEWLGYLPLGLELVGRYLEQAPDLTLERMLSRLQHDGLRDKSIYAAEATMTAKLGVEAAFNLSWERLDAASQELGCLLSLFATAPITWKLVEQVIATYCGLSRNSNSVFKAFQRFFSFFKQQNHQQSDKSFHLNTDITLEEAKINLLRWHLLQRKDEGIYQLHPLLREFFQYKLTGLEQVEEFKRSFCGVMVAVAKTIPQTPTLEQITDFAPAIPHIAEVANNLIQYLSDDDLICPFIGNARFYDGQGLYDKAAPWFEQCLEITKNRLGESHPSVATSLHNLAYLYNSQGRYSKAELLYLQALDIFERQLGVNHPHTVTVRENLAYFRAQFSSEQ